MRVLRARWWSLCGHPAGRNSERESSEPDYMTILNFNDIEFLMTPKNIKKFDRLNNMSINMYNIEE